MSKQLVQVMRAFTQATQLRQDQAPERRIEEPESGERPSMPSLDLLKGLVPEWPSDASSWA